VAGHTLQTDAIVIDRRPAMDSFQTFHAFSPNEGVLTILLRVPKKSGSSASLDLFDTAGFLLESANQGRTWFVKEHRVNVRRTGIGKSYLALASACDLCAIIGRNPVHEESRPKVAHLLSVALDAFEAAQRADIVLFKALFRFARDEGYPVRQEWMPMLVSDDRDRAEALLAAPADQVSAAEADVSRLIRRLKDYLRGHSELIVE
jgi:hypothetical protein